MAETQNENEGQGLSDEEKQALADQAAKDEAKAQEEREAALTDAQKEEQAAARGETLRRDLSDAETAVGVEEADEKGFYGTKVDPLPNAAYSVAGVTGGTAKAKAKPKSQGGSGK